MGMSMMGYMLSIFIICLLDAFSVNYERNTPCWPGCLVLSYHSDRLRLWVGGPPGGNEYSLVSLFRYKS